MLFLFGVLGSGFVWVSGFGLRELRALARFRAQGGRPAWEVHEKFLLQVRQLQKTKLLMPFFRVLITLLITLLITHS